MPIAPWTPAIPDPFARTAQGGATGPVNPLQAGWNTLIYGTRGANVNDVTNPNGMASVGGTGYVGSAGGTGGTGSGSNVTGQSAANNLSAAPDISSLTQLINNLNIAGQQQANAARIPNATGLETQSSTNIGSLLGGNIPQDVITQLAQQAAERGVAIGSPGSDNTNSSLLRSLGLTSLDLQQLGQQNLSAAYARNPVARLFDPTSQLITPYQQGELNNQANRLALDWYSLLHPQYGGGGGRGGGGQQQPQQQAPDMSWFQNALNRASNLNTGGPIGVPAVGLPPQTTYGNNPITDLDFGFGQPNPIQDTDFGFGDTSGVGYDIAAPPTSFGYDQPIDYSNYDPFGLYGGG